MSPAPQSFKNHTKFVPIYHAFALPVAAANAVTLLILAVREPSWSTIIAALMGIVLAIVFVVFRVFALTVQDRVIRLEMRLRLREVLPPELQPRIPELTRNQLVALRFAGDKELPALVRRVLDEHLDDRKAIKMLIQDWQPDHLRA